jgi:2-polyprenyl-3-methyl-5-hydroxy-6-metoxy-1,4-benzoquinol methylase
MNELSLYAKIRPDYFSNPRKDILPLLPQNTSAILEIGCGKGETLDWIKSIRFCRTIVGVELSLDVAKVAKNKIDFVIQGDIEEINLPYANEYFDLILCLDVLEHLKDPWSVIKKLTKYLKAGGILIASIPNVRHYKVIIPLILFGQWNYVDSGILDKTHLRFFTKKSAIDLVSSSGLKIDKTIVISPEKNTKGWLFNLILLGLLSRIFESHYLIRAVKI